MIDQSLPKNLILKDNREFSRVFKTGQHFSCKYFNIYFVKEKALRVGFTTSRAYKNKPARNKMKRLLRELWRRNFRKYKVNAYIVLAAKPSILQARWGILEEKMNEGLMQIEKAL